jgi:gliding motility-associated-like protein
MSILNKTTGVFAPTKSIPDTQNKVAITYTTTTITPARKCPSSKTKDVVVNPIPDSAFYVTKTTVCMDDTFHLIVKKPVNNTVYTWDLGNGEIIKKDSPFNYSYSKDGNFTIKLEATLANCKVSKKLVDYIHVVPKPTFVNFSQSENEIDFYFPEIRFTSYTNGTFFHWNFGDGTYSTLKNPIHIFPEKPGEYMVELTASNMEQNTCSVSIKHSIFMPEPLIYFIPNSFTPNGDELNNVFKPIFTSGYDPYNYSFYIYNRWGTLIFESHNTDFGWDGTFGNKFVENDTYIWKLEFKEKIKEDKYVKTGHVNIIK